MDEMVEKTIKDEFFNFLTTKLLKENMELHDYKTDYSDINMNTHLNRENYKDEYATIDISQEKLSSNDLGDYYFDLNFVLKKEEVETICEELVKEYHDIATSNSKVSIKAGFFLHKCCYNLQDPDMSKLQDTQKAKSYDNTKQIYALFIRKVTNGKAYKYHFNFMKTFPKDHPVVVV